MREEALDAPIVKVGAYHLNMWDLKRLQAVWSDQDKRQMKCYGGEEGWLNDQVIIRVYLSFIFT